MTTPTLRSILGSFAHETGQAETPQLGASAKTVHPAQVSAATTQMTELARKNSYVMQVAVGLVVALFAVCVVAAYYYRQDPKTVLLVTGGNALQLLLLVGWLRRLWVEKTAVETLLVATGALPSAEAAKILLAFYFKAMKIK